MCFAGSLSVFSYQFNLYTEDLRQNASLKILILKVFKNNPASIFQ